jgi:hypothetical protein
MLLIKYPDGSTFPVSLSQTFFSNLADETIVKKAEETSTRTLLSVLMYVWVVRQRECSLSIRY